MCSAKQIEIEPIIPTNKIMEINQTLGKKFQYKNFPNNNASFTLYLIILNTHNVE
jgi:hypothetical protein